ncbi:hypothetical protein LG634_24570 [Streptomyces bambusae]|uniref:hypothetical protein n=1 Tax=Streptomyces bambusae TaxID=1550616 RepID=UPI001CFE78F3|nr:hypothetical protein [Streptomyces bambusae]MCB5167988.1 hypothetical protein [Streptomyces bambusae]
MAKTGPQKYPGADLSLWFQDDWPGTAMESNVGVVHTTEGRTVPGYRGGRDAPTFTLLPDIQALKLRVFQHFDFDVSSRALVNLAGGVETNTANAVQFELVGTCDERNAETWDGARAGVDYLFWPDAPDWALAELGRIVRWAHDQHGIKMQSTVTWKAYKKGQTGGSYGANGVRLTGAEWSAYYGWLGHQHVPENAHGDPGDLDFARVLAHATGTATEDPDMALTQAELAKIALSVHSYKGKLPDGKTDPRDAYAYLRDTAGSVAALNTKLGALSARVEQLQTHGLTDEQIEQLARKLSGPLATAAADLIAARMVQ